MEQGARQPLQHAPGSDDRGRPDAGTSDRHPARQGHPADPRAGDHQVHQARANPERAAHEVLGPAHASGRPRASCPKASIRTRGPLPLVIFHGHFPQTFGGFREEPPDPNLKPEYSERFHWPATTASSRSTPISSTRNGPGPTIPRMIIIEIQHANPFYDDSYAVNSANLGPTATRSPTS